MTTTSIPTARRGLVTGAALALTIVVAAGCSSSSDQKSSAKHLKRAAATKHVDEKKKTSSTTTAPAPTAPPTTAAPAAPACLSMAEASKLVGNPVVNVDCLGTWAAGDFTDTSAGNINVAYVLWYQNGAWAVPSTDVANDVCTTNTYGLPSSFVNMACDD